MAHLALVGESNFWNFDFGRSKASSTTSPLLFRASCCLGESGGTEESDCGEVDQEASRDPPQPRVRLP